MAITSKSITKPNSLSFYDAVTKASKVALSKIERKITLYVLAYKEEDEWLKEIELEELTHEMIEHCIKYINFYTKEQDPNLSLFNNNIDNYKADMLLHQKEVLRNLINNIWYN